MNAIISLKLFSVASQSNTMTILEENRYKYQFPMAVIMIFFLKNFCIKTEKIHDEVDNTELVITGIWDVGYEG